MRSFIKLLATVLILSSILISFQADSQALPVAEYVFEKYIYNAVLRSTLLRRVMSTAANDADFATQQAETLRSIQDVVQQEAANAQQYAVSPTTLIQTAVQEVSLSQTLLGLNWYGLALSIGATAIDDLLTARVVDANKKVQEQYKLSVTNTSSGLRTRLQTVPPPTPVQPKPLTGQALYDQTLNAIMANGGIVFRSPNCLPSSPCAAYPTFDKPYAYFANMQPSTQSSIIGPYAQPVQVIQDYIVAFPDSISLTKSLDVQGFCALPYVNLLSSGQGLAVVFNISLWLDADYYPQYGPVCKHSIQSQMNADNTQIFNTIYNTVPSASTVPGPDGYPSVDDNGKFLQNPGFSTLPFKQNLLDGSLLFPTLSVLDAYGVSYTGSVSGTVGKITLGNSLPSAQLSASVMANLLNKLWQKAAARPDYKGLPYPSTNPIPATEIDPIPDPATNPNPDPAIIPLPTIGDIFEPVFNPTPANPDGQPYISPVPDANAPEVAKLPEETPAPTPPPNASGPDLTHPPVVVPDLEAIPSALSILQPLLDLIKPYQNLTINAPQGVCPTGSFVIPAGLFNDTDTTYTISTHCDFFETIRDTLSAVMLTFFSVIAFRTVMKA